MFTLLSVWLFTTVSTTPVFSSNLPTARMPSTRLHKLPRTYSSMSVPVNAIQTNNPRLYKSPVGFDTRVPSLNLSTYMASRSTTSVPMHSVHAKNSPRPHKSPVGFDTRVPSLNLSTYNASRSPTSAAMHEIQTINPGPHKSPIGFNTTVPSLNLATHMTRRSAKSRPVARPKSLASSSQTQRVSSLLDQVPLIDGHNDLPWNLRVMLKNQLNHFNFSSDLRQIDPWKHSAFSHTDLPRLRKGRVAAQVWSVHVPCEAQFRNAVQLAVEQVDVVRRMIDSTEEAVLATTPEEIIKAWKNGHLASLISVGGGHTLGSSVGILRSLHDLGVTSLALTHACHTPWAESDQEAEGQASIRGLTNFGKEVIREMNRLGMLVDLTHTSTATARDAMAASRAPVIYSHAAVRALCDIPRNVPDTILRALADNGGLVMVTFDSDVIACGQQNASVASVIGHLDHIRLVAGSDHVGLGSAFDGFDRPVPGLWETSEYPALFAALLDASPPWSEEELLKLAGKNFLRVFRRAQQVREEMSDVKPSEAIIPFSDIDNRWPCRYKFTRPHHPFA